MKKLNLHLNNPSFNTLHKAALGGLACALNYIEKKYNEGKLSKEDLFGGVNEKDNVNWTIYKNRIVFNFIPSKKDVEKLYKICFKQKDNCIYLPFVWKNISSSFLSFMNHLLLSVSHPSQFMKKTVFDTSYIDGKMITNNFVKLNGNYLFETDSKFSIISNSLFKKEKKDILNGEKIKVGTEFFPTSDKTSWEYNEIDYVVFFMPFLFASIFHFEVEEKISSYKDSKYIKRIGRIVPSVNNLIQFIEFMDNFDFHNNSLLSLKVCGSGEALLKYALKFQIIKHIEEFNYLECDSCIDNVDIYIYGKENWNGKQKPVRSVQSFNIDTFRDKDVITWYKIVDSLFEVELYPIKKNIKTIIKEIEKTGKTKKEIDKIIQNNYNVNINEIDIKKYEVEETRISSKNEFRNLFLHNILNKKNIFNNLHKVRINEYKIKAFRTGVPKMYEEAKKRGKVREAEKRYIDIFAKHYRIFMSKTYNREKEFTKDEKSIWRKLDKKRDEHIRKIEDAVTKKLFTKYLESFLFKCNIGAPLNKEDACTILFLLDEDWEYLKSLSLLGISVGCSKKEKKVETE